LFYSQTSSLFITLNYLCSEHLQNQKTISGSMQAGIIPRSVRHWQVSHHHYSCCITLCCITILFISNIILFKTMLLMNKIVILTLNPWSILGNKTLQIPNCCFSKILLLCYYHFHANTKNTVDQPVVVKYLVGGHSNAVQMQYRVDTSDNHLISIRGYRYPSHLKECSACSGRLLKIQHSWKNFTN